MHFLASVFLVVCLVAIGSADVAHLSRNYLPPQQSGRLVSTVTTDNSLPVVSADLKYSNGATFVASNPSQSTFGTLTAPSLVASAPLLTKTSTFTTYSAPASVAAPSAKFSAPTLARTYLAPQVETFAPIKVNTVPSVSFNLEPQVETFAPIKVNPLPSVSFNSAPVVASYTSNIRGIDTQYAAPVVASYTSNIRGIDTQYAANGGYAY